MLYTSTYILIQYYPHVFYTCVVLNGDNHECLKKLLTYLVSKTTISDTKVSQIKITLQAKCSIMLLCTLQSVT